jgi:hypothetical protein
MKKLKCSEYGPWCNNSTLKHSLAKEAPILCFTLALVTNIKVNVADSDRQAEITMILITVSKSFLKHARIKTLYPRNFSLMVKTQYS